ncbi:hypothetical protein [Halohasta salina]|uniref:hypothetical protein n=1 Tax=Halohasta salina TaxID=2961621 RepID=UPI0020A520E3|nr:hypothetical protein [Halohasta salina]
MTVIAVLAKPPRAGLVLSELAATTPLSEHDVAAFYEAMLRDTMLAVDRSGGELLVNYLPEDELPDAYHTDVDPVAELRSIAADTLDDVSNVRFEPQVGSTVSARAGNTITHLLETEEVASAAVVFGTAPLLSRTLVDSAAMKLRTNAVVVGPATEGRAYYAGFTEPVDFEGCLGGIELQRLANRAADADLDTEFLPMSPRVDTKEDLLSLLPLLRARFTAERIVPEHTAAFVYDHGLDVIDGDDGPELVVDAE